MIPLNKAFSSSVGKKLVMALSGLALTLFVVTHLLGNLSLYQPDGTTFNIYAASLEGSARRLAHRQIQAVGADSLRRQCFACGNQANGDGGGQNAVTTATMET